MARLLRSGPQKTRPSAPCAALKRVLNSAPCAAFGRTEPDEEIQDLLKFSEGLNLALHYLSGAINFDPVVNRVEPELAEKFTEYFT